MKAHRGTPLFASIAMVIVAYGALEAFAFIATAAAFGFSPSFVAVYLGVQITFQACLCAFLFAGSSFFYIVRTGERLSRVNTANKITLLRISMLPFVLFLIVAARDFAVGPVLIPALTITFVTDLMDGRISRTRDQVTMMGKILDSVSDYSLLIVVAVAYFIYRLLPAWLFWIIVSRLIFQAVGMLSILIARKKVEPHPTMLGKVAVATLMTLFAIEALKLVLPPKFLGYFAYAEAAAGVIVVLSVIDKGYFFYRQAKRIAVRSDDED